MNFVVAVEASSQFDTVYGGAYARELRDIFPAALIMYGAAEMDMLRRAEEWSLQTTRRQESFDQATGAKTLSSQLGSTLDYRRLMPPNDDHSRLWLRGREGIQTEIPEWTEFIGAYDQAVRHRKSGGRHAKWRVLKTHRRPQQAAILSIPSDVRKPDEHKRGPRCPSTARRCLLDCARRVNSP